MALIPNRTTPARGIVGTWANMEEDNARTKFAGEEFAAGVPVMLGSDTNNAAVYDGEGKFIGIALGTNTMYGSATTDGEATFSVGDIFGVADMGCVFVLSGEDVTEGADAYYDPATRKFHGASGGSRIVVPNCEFDESGTEGEPVALRIRVVPGTTATITPPDNDDED